MIAVSPRKRGVSVNRKPTLLWIDLTVSVRHAELSTVFTDACEVVVCPDVRALDQFLERGGIDAICFDVDYPDQESLSLLRSTKRRFPGVPILFLTLQHSESLAIWAFRSGVKDYLVKPVSRTELHRCLRSINHATECRNRQDARRTSSISVPIPVEIPQARPQVDSKLLPAIYFVEQNFHYKIRSEKIADLCKMSPFRFSRSFHETYGITFQDFVVRYRILQACRLFNNPNVNITDVAYAVGFNDGSYFSRTFRRHVGVSPSDYCASLQNEGNPVADIAMLGVKLGLPVQASARYA